MRDTTSPLIRAARLDDLEPLGRIWQELMDMHERSDPAFALAADGLQKWLRMTRDLISRHDAFVFVALREHSMVGFCLGWVAHNPPIYATSEVGFLSEIAVTKSMRRSGIGRALIEQARRWFSDRDLNEFQLSTAVWNHDAQKFWRSIGGEPLLVRYRFVMDG